MQRSKLPTQSARTRNKAQGSSTKCSNNVPVAVEPCVSTLWQIAQPFAHKILTCMMRLALTVVAHGLLGDCANVIRFDWKCAAQARQLFSRGRARPSHAISKHDAHIQCN